MNILLEITDAAKDKIKEVLSENTGKYLRITIEAGWGSPRLGLALDELDENEETIPVNGLDLLMSDSVMPYADGITIDYIHSPEGTGFVIGKHDQTGCKGCSCWPSWLMRPDALWVVSGSNPPAGNTSF